MEKSRDDVKRFLSIPMELDRKIYETEEIIETLRARAAKTTSQLSPAPGGGSGDKGKVMEELVIRIDELEQEAERMRQEKEKAAAEVTLLLSQMPNSAEVKVLPRLQLSAPRKNVRNVIRCFLCGRGSKLPLLCIQIYNNAIKGDQA